jgi:hypothetical protein
MSNAPMTRPTKSILLANSELSRTEGANPFQSDAGFECVLFVAQGSDQFEMFRPCVSKDKFDH